MRVDGLVAEAGEQRRHHRGVQGRLGDAQPPHHVDVKVQPAQLGAQVFFQHRLQQGQPVAVHAQGGLAGIGQGVLAHQGLHLDQQGAGALQPGEDDGARRAVHALLEEQGRGVGDFDQPFAGHAEQPDLVDRAVTVLHRAQHALGPVALAFQVEHHVHHVFQGAGAGQGAFLGHVTDQQHGGRVTLGMLDHPRRAGANLGDASGQGIHLLAAHGLDGIDHDHRRRLLGQDGQDALQLHLGQHADPIRVQSQPFGAVLDLGRGFLARDVQGAMGGLGDAVEHLQHKGRFADARVASQQAHRPGHEAAPQHPVDLAEAGGEPAAQLGLGNLVELLHRGPRAPAPHGRRGCGGPRTHPRLLLEGVPLLALGAAAQPLGEARPAIRADVFGGRFCHGGSNHRASGTAPVPLEIGH